MTYRYSVYGLTIDSDFPLPELFPMEEAAQVDVVVRKGQRELPAGAEQKTRYGYLRSNTAFCRWSEIGNFWLCDGREIVVEPAPGVADHLLRPFLLGPILAFLLHLRHFLVIHASASALVLQNGPQGVVGFMGHSEAGKSTMATALRKCGHLAVSDDIIAIPVQPAPSQESLDSKPPLICAGPPYLKLRPPSIQTFGEDIASMQRWYEVDDSYALRYEKHSLAPPLPLRSLYILEANDAIEIVPMPPEEALMTLVNQSYCVRNLDAKGKADNFLQCSRVTQITPIFRLRRPRDFSRLPEVVRTIEKHQASF